MESTHKLRDRTSCEGPEGIHPLRILVVDDSAISRKLAEYAFEGKPYDVSFAEDGRRALQRISQRNPDPDIVITDWLMPDLSGTDLCRLIRQKLQRKDIYLVLLTSNSDQRDIAKGMASGADGYLTKPLQADKLFAEIHMARAVIKARRSGNPHAMPIPRSTT
ncbi:MAG TPA: response regulator [Candidatus Acidoferrum sp.]|nr:response regulator [Candidatus Acidoferrum sp.]